VANFVYGDSCISGDDKYVIAQFRHDAPMGWVAELRAFLVKDELKYKYFQPERHRIVANKPLWHRVRAGVERAEITIVDPFEYQDRVLFDLQESGAEPGYDFDSRIVFELTSDALIEDSPLRAAQMSQVDWLPNNFDTGTREDFSTEKIRHRVGGKRRDAVVTAARAHAMVSPSEKWDLIRLCSGFDMPNMMERLAIIKKMGRVFDVEHAKSVELLNEFYDRIAEAARIPGLGVLNGSRRMVTEENSEAIDHIQGADIAAGWAVDTLMYTNGDYPTLARQFAWVSVNGIVVPG
jgi:hypothetical protein